MPTALIAGATGLVGSHLLPLLLENYDQVISLSRRPLDTRHPKLTQVITDFEDLPAVGSPGDVYCALGTTIKKAGSQPAFRKVDHDYPLAMARHAAAAGARQFLLVSSVGANRRSSNFYLHVKGELEEALAALPFRSLHLFRPSFLLGARQESRPGEGFATAAAQTLSPLLIGPLRQYRPISAERVAQSMIAAARDAAPGRHVYDYDRFV